MRSGARVLDVRGPAEFATGHIPGALHIGLGGQFASWAGTLVSPEAPIVLVTEDEAQVAEARTRLARVGLENVAAYLDGGILAWDGEGRPLARMEQIGVDELHARLAENADLQVLDVRRPAEWRAGHIAGATHIPLNELAARAGELDPKRPVAVICASGYRSSIAASVLEQAGLARPINVVGGMTAWNGAKYEVAA